MTARGALEGTSIGAAPPELGRGRLLALEAMSQVGSWEMDLDSGELWWSEVTHSIHETDPGGPRLTFTGWLEFFPSEVRPGPRDAMVRLLTSGAPFGLVLPLMSAAGSPRWVRITAAAELQGDEVARVFGTCQDVSPLHEASDALLRARNRLQATLDAIPDLLMELDAAGRFIGWHSGATELLAAPPEAFLGRTLEEAVPPEVAAVGRAAMKQAVETGRATGLQYCIDLPEGPRWFELSGRRKDPQRPGQGVEFIMLARDVTDRRRAEIATLAALEEAERANRAKSLFLAMMSHEIRTPMNGVVGVAAVLEEALPEPEQRRMLAVIRESGELALNVINDALDMAKIESGKLELEEAPFSPLEVARKVESAHRLRAAERGVSFSVSTTAGAESPRRGDPHRLLQILHNLVSNALKFTERGAVAVTLRCEVGRPLRIEVRDTGVGMTDEQVARVFEEFRQADTSVTRRFGGTGLGMSIVRRIVLLMRGEISVTSTIGEGTCVEVELPLPVVTAAEPPRAASASTLSTERRLRGIRVLAADDNHVNRLVMRSMLDKLGAAAVLVEDGQRAVDAASRQGYDALLLDISMPEIDGLEALRRIRAAEAAAGRPRALAVAVTANAMEHQVAEYLAAGFDAHVAKPIRPERLIEALLAAQARKSGVERP